MHDVLLINPNSSAATTEMMVGIARTALPDGYSVRGCTARGGPPMIVTRAELAAAAPEVLAKFMRHGVGAAGVIVGGYGDPGLAELRAVAGVPAVGICEASMLEAAAGGRRFGIATVTPELVADIDATAHALGLSDRYSGTRLTRGEPRVLAADPQALADALAAAVLECIERDRAQAVIIGGGPLGQAADTLAPRFEIPVIAPIPSAVRRLVALIRATPLAAAKG